MTFMVSWKLDAAYSEAAIARFLETGGGPPEGVKLIGRWHGMNGGGVAIAETDNPKALYSWYASWTDLISLEVTPCVDDATGAEVLASLKGS